MINYEGRADVNAFKVTINIKRCQVVLLPIRCLRGASVSEFDSNSNVLEQKKKMKMG